MAPAAAAGAQFAGQRVTAQAEPCGGFGASAMGDLQRGFQQGVVDPLAHLRVQAFGAFGVFLMKQYYETIPEELSEAARIDGLSEYAIWRKIMLPLSIPALASLTLLTFVNKTYSETGQVKLASRNSQATFPPPIRAVRAAAAARPQA